MDLSELIILNQQESHCIILRSKIDRIRDKFNDDVMDILSIYKTEVDECLYYLSDEFKCLCESWHDLRYIDSSLFGRISYSFDINIKDISKFFDGCTSVISRLESMNVKFILTFQYKNTDGMLFSPKVSNILSKKLTLDYIIKEVSVNNISDFTISITTGIEWQN